jgi:hypothetical protein
MLKSAVLAFSRLAFSATLFAGALFAGAAHAQVLPLGAGEWTTLYATFDRDTHAGHAGSTPYAAGNTTAIVPGGVAGNALQLQNRLANLVYRGDNVPSTTGTIRVFVKSPLDKNLWSDGREYWLLVAERENALWHGAPEIMAAQPGFHLLLYKTASNEIAFALDNTTGQWLSGADGKLPADPMPVNARLDASQLAPGKWHEIIVSWDAAHHRFWLRVGDKQVTGQMPENFRAGEFTYLMLGTQPNVFVERQGHFPGLMDELLVSDRALPQWLDKSAPQTAERAFAPAPNWPRSQAVLFQDEPQATYEAQIRTYLDTQAAHRNAAGGWAWSFAYPSGMHFLSNSVRAPYSDHLYNNAKDGTSTLAALRYAMAYEALGDEKYLTIAEDIAARVMQAQQNGGWWPYWWTQTPNGIVPYLPDKAPIEDHTQTGPIFLLLYLHRLTERAEYSQAAQAGLDFLIQAQNPNGSWSHHYNVAKNAGESATGVLHAGEFNDYTTTEPMAAMILAYRMTGEPRFLNSYLKAARWILSAFIDNSATGGAVGWAQQYDAQNQPIWARHFEPPAIENFASGMAASEMMNAYRLTGNKEFLEPVRKWLAWLQTKGPKYAFYHDPATGRPIVAEARQIYFLDDPAQVAAHRAAVERTGMPSDSALLQPRDWITMQNYLKRAAAMETETPLTLERAAPTRESIVAEVKRYSTILADWAPKFDWKRGAYIVTESGAPGVRIGVGSPRVVAPLWILARERALRGDVSLSHPLLRMPYDIEPATVVAPHWNLYARLKAN